MKRVYFLGGLPRSGGTLLSSILNENPSVYATPQAETFDLVRLLHQQPTTYESFQLGHLHDSYKHMLASTFDGMYGHRPEQVIVDKSSMWGAPYYRDLLVNITGARPRIVCPVRPLAEIVASFIVKADENPDTNFIDRDMRDTDFWPYYRKPLNDARVDWLLSPRGLLDGALLGLAGAFVPEWSDCYHLIEYRDLVTRPDKALAGIYDFLDEPRYPHTFDAIMPSPSNNDAQVMGVPDLHAVRPTLAIQSPAPEDVLSDYAMTRCVIEDFWTGR